MTLRLECDQCGEEALILEELRAVSVSRGDTMPYRNESATAHLHWDCITPYILRKNNEDQEPPF